MATWSEIASWAKANGHYVPARGRVSNDVVAAFNVAHGLPKLQGPDIVLSVDTGALRVQSDGETDISKSGAAMRAAILAGEYTPAPIVDEDDVEADDDEG